MAAAAAAGPSAVRSVFVYGSLLAPEVVRALLHRLPPSAPAVVRDFHRYSIRARVYPAALHAKGSEIIGKVLFELTDKELDVLDDFEDVEYIREIVEPIVLDAKGLEISITEPLKSGIYLWANPDDKDLYGDWDYETWREDHLAEFLQKYFS